MPSESVSILDQERRRRRTQTIERNLRAKFYISFFSLSLLPNIVDFEPSQRKHQRRECTLTHTHNHTDRVRSETNEGNFNDVWRHHLCSVCGGWEKISIGFELTIQSHRIRVGINQ